MTAGTLTYETKLNTSNFQKGINDINNKVQSGGTKMKSIIGALGITKLISAGINMITNSIDGAISRLDTMNNFPKVMSNLGISATESRKAINKLSDGLQGLPTTLDAGALAVQRFTARNGDIDKSTKLFLALNNAILAGGASTQIQESALEQLTQAYSKGKMDMMEWRTLQQAMPAQLKQVADTMGLDVDALGEMMRQGDNTDEVMDKFLDTIVDLNENGGKNIKSFAEQAKNATDGIRTNMTNMRTAISRGTASILDNLNKALKKANINGIGELLSKTGKKIEEVLKNIGKQISKIDIKSLISVLKKLVPVIEMVVAGFVAYQVVLKAISIINIIQNIMNTISAFISLIPAITSAKDAMLLLNLVMDANPIGVVIGAVAALSTGLLLLVNHVKKQKEAMSETDKVIKDYDTSMKEANKARQEYLDKNMVEVKSYQDLANELSNLVDENGKVKEGYEERAQFIVTTLNDALGTEIKMTDGVISNYGDIKKSIQEVIATKRAETLLNAEEEKYNKAKSKQKDLEEEYNNQVKETKKSLDEKHSLEKDLSELYGLTVGQLNDVANGTQYYAEQLGLTADDYDLIKAKLGGVNEEYSNSLGELEKIKGKYEENQLVIGNYEAALGYLKDGNYEAVLKMYEDTTNYQGKTADETYKNYGAAIQAQKLYLDDLKKKQGEYDEQTYNNLVSSGESKLKELEDQQKKYKTATDVGQKDVKSIWDMSLEDQIKTLQNKKVDFKKTADGHIQAYVNGQKSGEPVSTKEANKMMKNIEKEMKKSNGYGKQSGLDLTSGTTSGIQSGQGSTFLAVQNYGSSILSNLRSALKEHSPSKASREMGGYLIEGFEQGIEDEEKNAYRQIEDFGDEVLDRMENAVNMETGKMSFNGTSGSVSQILSANAQFEGNFPIQVDLDGEKIYSNQQKITARKNLQYGGVR